MLRFLSLFIIAIGTFNHGLCQDNMVTYAGSSSKDGFYDVTQLSDGTFLVCGYTEALDWIETNVPMTELSYSGTIPNSLGSNRFGYLLHFSSDLQNLLHVVHFGQGVVEDIRFIKTNTLPYQTTGDLFISCNTSDTYANDGGYIIAKLNNNFVNGVPTALDWHRVVWAESYAKDYHPWDVTASGEVYYVSGAAHGYDWSAMYKLNSQGQRMVVENWRTHWLTAGGEWRGTPASAYPNGGLSAISHSGIALKIWDRCELRSWTQQEFDAIHPDGNGGTKKGTWPADILFSGPCDPQNPTAVGPGYTGYSAEACCPVWGASSVVVDRRNGKLYLGMNFKSYSNPFSSPDFEPAVIAFDATGQMEWWSRLYHEITPAGDTVESLPDQYVDALAIDYANDLLVVGGRTHGNNVENFWEGNTIASNPNAFGFQNRFTGTNGNIHESWLGKLQLSDGTLIASTYMAELAEGTGSLGTPHADPNLDGWPDPNTGWPDVNTTRMAKNGLKVSSNGDVCIAAVGRRTITTANAYQEMVKPYFGGLSCWNSFVRVYDTDLHVPKYSSLVVGAWDTLTQAGGSNTELFAVHKTADGVVCVGRHTATNGQADGNNIPVVNVPDWGNSSPVNESCILVYYKATNLINPTDGPGGITGFSDSSVSTQNMLRIFPNPTSDQVYLTAFAKEISVYDALGKCMMRSSLTDHISTISLSNGLYIVSTDGQHHRLVVQH
ncbi:MAG: hypothetical protein RL266_1348 [Bacteroidota bacterium]